MADSLPVSDEVAYQIDFNFHQVPSALAVDIPDEAAASMLKLDTATFKSYVAYARAEVRKTAEALASLDDVARAVRKIKADHDNPVSRVMMIGDSITTYRYGHAELLRALLETVDPASGFELLNMGRSGYTSTHALEHVYTIYLPMAPDWVILKYGVNDTKRFGGPDAKLLVSLEEYTANLDAVVSAFKRFTKARIVVITPTPVLESVVNTTEAFIDYHMTWQNSDIEACAAAVKAIAAKYKVGLVDMFSLFTGQPKSELLLSDGLHPSRLGQQMIVEQVLRTILNTSL